MFVFGTQFSQLSTYRRELIEAPFELIQRVLARIIDVFVPDLEQHLSKPPGGTNQVDGITVVSRVRSRFHMLVLPPESGRLAALYVPAYALQKLIFPDYLNSEFSRAIRLAPGILSDHYDVCVLRY